MQRRHYIDFAKCPPTNTLTLIRWSPQDESYGQTIHIPSSSSNPSPSNSNKHLNIITQIVVKCGKDINLVNTKEDMPLPTLDHIHVDQNPLGIIN
jgi:hypothetical protein